MSKSKRRIAISDIHGHKLSFQNLLDKIGLNKSDELYLLGDFIDRGPDSKGVLDLVRDLIDQGYLVYPTLGNHEDMLLVALAEDPRDLKLWTKNGGAATLESFNVKKVTDIPSDYIAFLDSFWMHVALEECILVHAGLNFNIPEPLKDQEAMLWIRRWYEDINYDWLDKRIIVHGHTPTTEDQIKKMLDELGESLVIDIDCGCFRKDYQGYGKLCAFDISNYKLYFQDNIG